MVIHYFNLKCVALMPLETDPPLVIDTDAVLARTITAKYLESIGRWDTQVLQSDRTIQHAQFAERHLLNVVR